MSVLGVVEFATVLSGMKGSDAMVKAAPIELLQSHPIDPGKYLAVATGDLASVEAAVEAALTQAGESDIVESFVLANLHEQILPALRGEHDAPARDALGALETRTAASIIKAADTACKASRVSLLELRLARHLGGKGYTTFVGDIADVEAAVAAGAEIAGEALLEKLVLANPYPDFYVHLSREGRDGH